MSVKYRTCRITRLWDLKAGDHIRVPGYLPLYDHHMLVVGVLTTDKLVVIHYSKDGMIKVIKEEIIPVNYNTVELLEYVNVTAAPPNEAIERARFRMKERKYNIISNNCEHFINWAKTRVSQSNQVDSAIPAVGITAVGMLTGVYTSNRVGSIIPFAFVIFGALIFLCTYKPKPGSCYTYLLDRFNFV